MSGNLFITFSQPYFARLLDVCHGRLVNNELSLLLVFEHVDQDLSRYLEKCPSPGLGPDRIKVSADLSGGPYASRGNLVP